MTDIDDTSKAQEFRRITILAAASGGGHLRQLLEVKEAFEQNDLIVATTDVHQARVSGINDPVELLDYSQDTPLKMFRGLFEAFTLVFKVRPDMVISTGAAPGLLCLLCGRLMGAKTIWIDSIANSERLSLSGRLASKFSHKTLTQWKHLANGTHIEYWGSVF
ncbi:glucuronosyltransferase [Desulfosediminicola sp.]|uniref:glucuronosyltransferase n=1 Tax=Desulfosediminicola sp. TaxID=2886825 RepID=UPI003AF2E51C